MNSEPPFDFGDELIPPCPAWDNEIAPDDIDFTDSKLDQFKNHYIAKDLMERSGLLPKDYVEDLWYAELYESLVLGGEDADPEHTVALDTPHGVRLKGGRVGSEPRQAHPPHTSEGGTTMPFTKGNRVQKPGRRKSQWFTSNESPFLTLQGAVRATGLPLHFLKRAILSGLLKTVELGHSRVTFIRRSDLSDFTGQSV